MADVYTPPGNFADFSAFVADANAINAATKTALKTAITNISNLLGTVASDGDTAVPTASAHPDFNKIDPAVAAAIQNELSALNTAITNHA